MENSAHSFREKISQIISQSFYNMRLNAKELELLE